MKTNPGTFPTGPGHVVGAAVLDQVDSMIIQG
jgi:hypothetical protein